ncbi:hypothetical protein [Flavobacterium sp. MK4S-17]|uniref:hypothetical protein n=1 Tax=Flavobacterium sp. MK4S-17 TaxID=2543737 RepID=UPI0013578359|nr:hypothetical protein [Flavobacterium sp. MK4S-17]
MKKLILSVAVLAIMTVAACSSDDDGGKSKEGCVTCSITFEDGSNTKEVCNVDGIAFDDGDDTGVDYDDYVAGQESLGYNCN